MSPVTRALRTIPTSLAAGIAGAVGAYYALDGLWTVNRVGLLHRQGFPWSSLPIWIAVGAAVGLVRGALVVARLRRHEASFARTGRDADRPTAGAAGLELVPDDEASPWEVAPGLRAMPLLRERSGASEQTHEVAHRMVGTHRGRPIEIFDLTTEVRSGEQGTRRTRRRTVVLLPRTGLPAFELRPRSGTRAALRGMGVAGLDFDPGQAGTPEDAESVGAFNGSYNVALRDVYLDPAWAAASEGEPTTPEGPEDEGEVRRLFTPAAMRALNRRPGWSAESHGGHLALWREDGWFIPSGERPARVAEALAIVEALEAARSGSDGSGPVPAGPGPSRRDRLIRTQATCGVGCAGAIGGAFLGFGGFALWFTAMRRLTVGPVRRPGPPLELLAFPMFLLGGLIVGGLIGAAAGRLAVFPIVRDCPPLAIPGSPEASRRGRTWRSAAGFILGFLGGAAISMGSIVALMDSGLIGGRLGGPVLFLFFAGPSLGATIGIVLGLILDFRAAARAEARAASDRAVVVEDR